MIFAFYVSEDGDYRVHSYRTEEEYLEEVNYDYGERGEAPQPNITMDEFNRCVKSGVILIRGEQVRLAPAKEIVSYKLE